MKLTFYGSLKELQVSLASLGISGQWEPEPHGVVMLRCRNGANLHWSSTRKTLWVDGKSPAREQLIRKIEGAIPQRPRQARLTHCATIE